MNAPCRAVFKKIGGSLMPAPARVRVDKVRRACRRRPPAALRREQKRRLRAFYSGFVSPGHLCFDVGANRGNRTRVFRALGARVVAIEPQARCARFLKFAYCLDPRVKVREVALGAEAGEAELMIATTSTVSSMAPDWVEAVSDSGRFEEVSWKRRRLVKVTTLDDLIRIFGVPRFVKIDVEGHELEVLRGLSSAVPYLSFEFTPECGAAADACIDRLCDLGMGLFNYSFGESMQLVSEVWVGAAEMKDALARFSAAEPMGFGDVYAQALHRP